MELIDRCPSMGNTIFNKLSEDISVKINIISIEDALRLYLNPLRPTRRWTDAHFCRFLTVLEYSPIGEKIPPTTALRTLNTVQKKKFENFQK